MMCVIVNTYIYKSGRGSSIYGDLSKNDLSYNSTESPS